MTTRQSDQRDGERGNAMADRDRHRGSGRLPDGNHEEVGQGEQHRKTDDQIAVAILPDHQDDAADQPDYRKEHGGQIANRPAPYCRVQSSRAGQDRRQLPRSRSYSAGTDAVRFGCCTRSSC